MANELYDIGRDLRANKLEEMDIATIGTNELSEQQKEAQLMGATAVQGLMHQDTPRQLIIPQQVLQDDAEEEKAKGTESGNYGLPIKAEQNDDGQNVDRSDHKMNDEESGNHQENVNDEENENDQENGNDAENGGNIGSESGKDIESADDAASQEMSDDAKGAQPVEDSSHNPSDQNVEEAQSAKVADAMEED